MKAEKTDLGLTRVKLTVKADAADMGPIKNHVLAHFRHQVQVPGFRAGTAPLAVIEKNVDQNRLIDEFMEHALNQFYTQAVKHFELRPVGEPKVQLKKFVPFTDLEIEVETETIGSVALPDYKKIKIDKKKASVTADDVNEVIASLRQRLAERQTVERPAKNGDELTVDFSGKDTAGKAVAGTDAKDYPLVLGSGSFIPGFEDNLLGAKSGEKKEFKVKFPADYGAAALQNKYVTFSVDVKKVSQLSEPKLGDSFAAKAGPFKTMAELKADIKKQLLLERQQQMDRDYENRLIAEVVAQSKIDVPQGMIDEDVMRMEDEEKRNLAYRGQTWEEHLKEEGVTEQQHRERQRPRAEERIKAGIALGEIADKEKIQVKPAEVERRIQILKGQYQDEVMRSELDKPQARRDIENRMLTEKTIAKLAEISSN
ncbi:MAG TPA: trigger factor [Candidatus Saccharimonadales bacterium]|nr:trigger factor [Candidatus Saccharimonadales bacterium]